MVGIGVFSEKNSSASRGFHFPMELFKLLILPLYFTLLFPTLHFSSLSLISLLLTYNFSFFLFEKSYFPSFCLMVDYSEVRHLSPSVLLFFARLEAFINSFGGRCPTIEGFALGDSSLDLVLANLYPLLRQSLNWFKAMQRVLAEERMGSEVRLSNLEMG